MWHGALAGGEAAVAYRHAKKAVGDEAGDEDGIKAVHMLPSSEVSGTARSMHGDVQQDAVLFAAHIEHVARRG